MAEPDGQSSSVADEPPAEPEENLRELLDEALTPGPEREEDLPGRSRLLCGRRKGSPRTLTKKADIGRPAITPQQRLLLLDTWQRSGLPARACYELSVITTANRASITQVKMTKCSPATVVGSLS